MEESPVKVIKEFGGHSGANVNLIHNSKLNRYEVIKDNFNNSIESAKILNSLPFHTPEIYEVTRDKIVMEYIDGITLKTYLSTATHTDLDRLKKFLCEYIDQCLKTSQDYDFTDEISQKILSLKPYINLSNLFKNKNLTFPRSLIHGDFTLENIIFSNDNFYFIDSNPTNLNSIVFDFNKLRQDIEFSWFMRDINPQTSYKMDCDYLLCELKKEYPSLYNNDVTILMLSRILPYCKTLKNKNIVLESIIKLCL